MPVKLTPRLETALRYVRPGHRVADVGTDHAYLPIALCECGILPPRTDGAPAAMATDINRGPVERAEAHITAAGLSDRITTRQTNGLAGLDTYAPTDILIFGMGGELIAAILAGAEWVRDPHVRLILQPMTHAERLREFLIENGFSIIGETLSREGERIYQTLCAEWTGPLAGGSSPTLTPAELCVGQARHRVGKEQEELYVALIERTLATTTAARDARARAGLDTTTEDTLITSLTVLRDTP